MRKKSRDSSSRVETVNQTVDQTEEQSNKKKRQKFMTQKEIYKILRQVWVNEQRIVELIFGNGKTGNSFAMFFLTAVFVPPSRFRPESKMGDDKYLHDQTSILGKILLLNDDLKNMLIAERVAELVEKEGEKGKR